ncbi:diguanylate cyclase [Alteromonas sp. 1_MG-2023]|uniref:diguanylate cyclase n=1 Tax=Alteromonas sp. 1_MG-2023 TaxID=3062669 RepID=UPI0026E1F880|nr:diguanylate cyclase [Alteromonas sp. 1_MG-2023]MDO6567223.1 diguanylate cyclase [Alteromonas sp. 1_MG-2023]
MYKILVVEDSLTVRKVLSKLLESNPHLSPVLCETFTEAKLLLEKESDFLAAVVDLNLPDAPNGESVELSLSYSLPTIVLTGNFDEFTRAQLLDLGVLDYITKESRYSYSQVIKLIDRLRKNLTTKVLVVEDSITSRNYICGLLKKFHFQIFEASDGREALTFLSDTSDISLVISDHRMPNMDGYELVKAIRHDRRLQDLVFIGLSGTNDGILSSKFIKSGANDFLSKPFYHEEFFCRVMQNLDSQEMIRTIRASANIDSLTQVYNRRYLIEQGEAIFAKGPSGQSAAGVMVSMIDIDNFKVVNDNLGHKAGDSLLQEFATLLQEYFPTDLVVRYGGEEFTVIATGSFKQHAADISQFISAVRQTSFTQHALNVTCSIGICAENLGSLEEQIDVADKRLYKAKHTGKDKIVASDK